MGSYTVYLVGYRENDLTSDEHSKLDAHISKWSSGWGGDKYKPIDKRNPNFDNVARTFADEGPRADGKHIILYQEMNIDESKEKSKFLEAFSEIKSVFPNALFEAHDEAGKIA